MPNKKILKYVKSGIKFLMEFLTPIIFSLAAFTVIYIAVAQPFEVKGASMEPELYNREYILADKISYKFTHPKRGDIVIFRFPYNRTLDYIKRVIGLPGETLTIIGGKVYINYKVLAEDYLKDITDIYPDPSNAIKEGQDIKIPKDHYFVLGDNRPHSSDSRNFGPIPKNLIIGKAQIRYWPLDKIGLFELPNYSYGS